MILGHKPSAHPISSPERKLKGSQAGAGDVLLPGNRVATQNDLLFGSNNTGQGRYFGVLNQPGSTAFGLTPQPSHSAGASASCPTATSFEQTLFLGASIMSYSVNLGYGEQGSNLTVELVEDQCVGNSRTYYKGHNNLKWGNSSTLEPITTTRADNFDPPPVGSCVYFRVGDYEFCGILQGWTKTKSSSANPSYTVTINDPRELMSGINLVINDEVLDPVYIENILNVYGVMERYGALCSTSPVGGFGGARAHSGEGMPWVEIVKGIYLFQSGFSALSNIPPKRPRLRGSEFFIDLMDIPNVPDDYRIGGSVVSLNDAIAQVCEDAGHDFFIDLVPVIFQGSCYLVLKVKAIDRTEQQGLTAIQDFVDAHDEVMDSSVGREFRNDVTGAMVIGAPRQEMYQCECPTVIQNCESDGIVPYWGVYENGNMITGCAVPGMFVKPNVRESVYLVPLEINALNENLEIPIPIAFYPMTSYELRAAMMGQDHWMFYLTANPNHPVSRVFGLGQNAGQWDPTNVFKLIKKWFNDQQDGGVAVLVNNGIGNNVDPADMVALNARAARLVNKEGNNLGILQQLQIDKIYSWVQQYSAMYGKSWAVPVYSEVCTFLDAQTLLPVTSLEIVDSGWPTGASPIIGLDSSVYKTFFGGDDGKISTFVRFPTNAGNGAFGNAFANGFNQGTRVDLSEIDPDSMFHNGYFAWVAATTAEQDFQYINKDSLFRPHVAITTPGVARRSTIGAGSDGINKAAWEAVLRFVRDQGAQDLNAGDRDAFKLALLNSVGSNTGNIGMQFDSVAPQAAAVPLKSNVYNYGPWESLPTGPDGKTSVEVKSDLNPWTYAGTDLMDIAGQLAANQKVTYRQADEMGSVKMPGYPDRTKIGMEIGEIGTAELATERAPQIATIPGGGQQGGVGQYLYVDDGGKLDGSNGPTLTSIQVQVGAGGVTTQYSFKTYTPKFGRFSKLNADRLKRMGRARIQAAKNMREIQKKALGGFSRFITKRTTLTSEAKKVEEQHQQAQNANARGPQSPHSHFIGQQSAHLTPDEQPVVRHTIKSLSETEHTDFGTTNYDKKAFMGLEGLIRPVSVRGDGDLPAYYTPIREICKNSKTISHRPMPPITSQQGVVGGNYDININYLNPFTNPGDTKHVDPDTDPKSHGHDIGKVGRFGEAPPNHLNIHVEENNTGELAYADDYRMFALRGPLLLQSWGYDLQGKPMPNEADSEFACQGGTFVREGLKDNFLTGFLRKGHTWPVAPVDLRFDRDRGVWTIPPPPRFVLLKLGEEVKAGGGCSTEASIIDAPSSSLFDNTGEDIGSSSLKVKFENDLDCEFKKDDKVRAYYDDESCSYKPFSCPARAEITPSGCEDPELGTTASGIAYGKSDYMAIGIVDEDTYPTNCSFNDFNVKLEWPKIRGENADVVVVKNILTQPIKKGNRVILWRRVEHEKVLVDEKDCPEYECCLDDADPDKDDCTFDDGTSEDDKTPDGQFCCQMTDDQGNISIQGVDEEFECAYLGGQIVSCSSSGDEDECNQKEDKKTHCPQGECCEYDAETDTYKTYEFQPRECFHVVQAQFNALCVVTSVSLNEDYPVNQDECVRPISRTSDGTVKTTITDKKAVTRVKVEADGNTYGSDCYAGNPICSSIECDNCTPPTDECCGPYDWSETGCGGQLDPDGPDGPIDDPTPDEDWCCCEWWDYEASELRYTVMLESACGKLDGAPQPNPEGGPPVHNNRANCLYSGDANWELCGGITGHPTAGANYSRSASGVNPDGISSWGSRTKSFNLTAPKLLFGEIEKYATPLPESYSPCEGAFDPCAVCQVTPGCKNSEGIDCEVCSTCSFIPGGALVLDTCATNPGDPVGSFRLKACTDFDFDLEIEVKHPIYPLLHIDVCERNIWLQSAWSDPPTCSAERDASTSPFAGTAKGMEGHEMPVFNEPLHEYVEGWPDDYYNGEVVSCTQPKSHTDGVEDSIITNCHPETNMSQGERGTDSGTSENREYALEANPQENGIGGSPQCDPSTIEVIGVCQPIETEDEICCDETNTDFLCCELEGGEVAQVGTKADCDFLLGTIIDCAETITSDKTQGECEALGGTVVPCPEEAASTPDACEGNADCAPGFMCVNGECILIEDAGGITGGAT